jgi:hypothetical protein
MINKENINNSSELKYSDDDIVQIRGAVAHLLEINETLNANIIAMNAKLENEEKKVKALQYKLWLCQSHTINNYQA